MQKFAASCSYWIVQNIFWDVFWIVAMCCLFWTFRPNTFDWLWMETVVKVNTSFLIPFAYVCWIDYDSLHSAGYPDRIFHKIWKRAVANYFFVQVPSVSLLLYLFPLPDLAPDYTMFPSYFFALLCHDYFYYCFHRLAHKNNVLRRLHNKHHEIHGENLVALSALYAHPFDHLFLNVVPAVAGFVLLSLCGFPPSQFVACFWSAFSGASAAIMHMRGVTGNKHESHHITNTHMYGSVGIMDWLFSTTDVGFFSLDVNNYIF